jgi:hypothetical protein
MLLGRRDKLDGNKLVADFGVRAESERRMLSS